MLATKFRIDKTTQAQRKLIEDYLRVESDPLKKKQMLGLIGEIQEIEIDDAPATLREIEDMLTDYNVPAFKMAKKQDEENAPVDEEAAKWVKDEALRLMKDDQESGAYEEDEWEY